MQTYDEIFVTNLPRLIGEKIELIQNMISYNIKDAAINGN